MIDNYEQEKAEYSKKLESIIYSISQRLNQHIVGSINDDEEQQLRKLKEQAEVLKHKIDTGRFEIAVIGTEKTGKSTFINAVIDNDILPMDNKHYSNPPISIEYCAEGASAEIEYDDKKRVFAEDELESNELKDILYGHTSFAVKKMRFKTSILKSMPHLVIHDVTEIDNPTYDERFISNIDAVVLIVSAHQPSFTGILLDLVTKLTRWKINLNNKMFVFANKMDCVCPQVNYTLSEQITNNLEILTNDLNKYINFTRTDRIVVGSALFHLNKMNNDLPDGISEIKQILMQYYENEYYVELKKQINHLINNREQSTNKY